MGVFDLGASGGRFFAATVDNGKMTLDEIHRFDHHPHAVCVSSQTAPNQTHLYWDCFAIYNGLMEGLRRAAQRYRIVSLGIDTWGTDGTWYAPCGEPLGRMFCYRDHRLDRVREELFRRVSERILFDRTGIPSHPFNLINQIFWATRNQPEIVSSAEVFLPVPSILYYHLTGEKIADTTWLSTTQCMKAGRGEYCNENFHELDLPVEKMPRIGRPGTRLGSVLSGVAKELEAKPFEVVLTATHDTACAFVTAPVAPNRATLIVSSGTWSLVGINIPEPIVTGDVFHSRFANEGGVEGIRFLNNMMGTWLLQELRRVWAEQDGRAMIWPELEQMAAQAGPAKSVIDPDDLSFYNPSDMAEAIISFCRRTGQALPAGRPDVVRLAMESLALKTAWACRTVERLTGLHIDAVHIVGGGGKSAMLSQFIANATGLPVRVGPYDATAVGNALVQAVALGWFGSCEEGRRVVASSFEWAEYQPSEQGYWSEATGRFDKLLSSLKNR